jgi:hypothetical protein
VLLSMNHDIKPGYDFTNKISFDKLNQGAWL